MQGHMRVVLGNRVNNVELWEAGFIVHDSEMTPGSQEEDMIVLFE